MLNFCSLYSGSSGNCLFVETDNTKILIDAGVSLKKIENAPESLNVTPSDLDGVIVTQCEKISSNNKKNINICENFSIGDIDILPFSIPHDAADPCGYTLFSNNKKISIATDIGHMTNNIIKNIEGSELLLIESNYDPEVLKYTKYPFKLKERISGPKGHLSNKVAGQTIHYLINSGLKNAVLGHLSKESNFPELAYQTVIDELISQNTNLDNFKLTVASRDFPGKIINL